MSFFRSRWVERPAHVAELEPTALPAGFRAAGVAAGIKAEGLDVGLLVNDGPVHVSAARFTSSALLGAPVVVSKEAALDRLRATLASSGNANVADGVRGLETARAAQSAAAAGLAVESYEVGIAATGVIGRALPRERLLAGVDSAGAELAADSRAFSEAILTTDRAPKRACLAVELDGGQVRLAAQAKGAGMMSPSFATLLCFVETDAALSAATLDLLTGVTVKRSFDRISVDGQLSTSDTVFCLANGASGVRVEPETDDELRFGEALDALLRQLALEIVSDGEGCERIGRVVVRGAWHLVQPVARAVANSPLVKTALHGADPNFGRILQAAGQALAVHGGGGFAVDLEVEGRALVAGGEGLELSADDWRALEQAVRAPEVEYALAVPGEGGEAEVFFSDLSHGYVSLNADYTT
ncbi:MAG: bifunctional ornithine acetyltransferase/N-acetylglutamate synthase [Thermoleophilaceae bacterium]|nr:bifunctional ornithine acetyltransferase/N-acetylglutamate synthase [Thermoleophilaceae bacterium]